MYFRKSNYGLRQPRRRLSVWPAASLLSLGIALLPLREFNASAEEQTPRDPSDFTESTPCKPEEFFAVDALTQSTRCLPHLALVDALAGCLPKVNTETPVSEPLANSSAKKRAPGSPFSIECPALESSKTLNLLFEDDALEDVLWTIPADCNATNDFFCEAFDTVPFPTPTLIPSPTSTPTASATPSATPSPSPTPTPSPSETPTPSPTRVPSPTPTGTPTATPTATMPPSPTPTIPPQPSPTPVIPTPQPTPTQTPATPVPTPTLNPTPIATPPIVVIIPTPTSTPTPSPTASPTPTATPQVCRVNFEVFFDPNRQGPEGL